mmetsp:Transcript_14339/g.21646  ORF Transcript_14339/g.21646 Transcript_14339/m.21646 type:complete len:353 (-) Transcript_14339:217-1275(-)
MSLLALLLSALLICRPIRASVDEECTTTSTTTTLDGRSDRLGYVVENIDLRELDTDSVKRIHDALAAHGVIVLKNQPLSRREQVVLTSKLGQLVVLPPSFEGLDPEPGIPAIQRITSHWANSSWKGANHRLGGYFHQDGQFWPRSHRWINSILTCAQSPPFGGETGFVDLITAQKTLDPQLKARAANATITASVRAIGDFRRGLAEDLDLFDDATHPMIDTWPGSKAQTLADAQDDRILYVGSPHMVVNEDSTYQQESSLLPSIFDHVTRPEYTYYHTWSPGDVVIWDNTVSLHKAFPYVNTPDIKRELYRTQFRRMPTPQHLALHPAPEDYRPRWLDPTDNISMIYERRLH